MAVQGRFHQRAGALRLCQTSKWLPNTKVKRHPVPVPVPVCGFQVNAHSLGGLPPGTVVIAHPTTPHDQMFGRSIVLLYHNGGEGTQGLILNKWLKPSQEAFVAARYPWLAAEFGKVNQPARSGIGQVFVGGPVPSNPIILHTCLPAQHTHVDTSFDVQDYGPRGSNALTKFFVSTALGKSQRRQLKRLLKQHACPYREFLHMSSWAPSQLWSELLRHQGGWLTASLSTGMLQHVFEANFQHEEFWAETLHHMGGTFRTLARLHADPAFAPL